MTTTRATPAPARRVRQTMRESLGQKTRTRQSISINKVNDECAHCNAFSREVDESLYLKGCLLL